MTWTFRAKAKDERPLSSRVLLLLEQQMMSVRLFHAEVKEGRVQITFVIASEEDKTCRITSLLHRLQDVTSFRLGRPDGREANA